ncbi:MAG: ROK family protein [Anaerolineae bacterium]|nr:ROK family protein [Anaerolineae bacterium]
MSSSHYIAVDLGGTQIRAARFSESHEMETRFAVETGADEGFDAVFSRVTDAVRQVWPASGDVAAVGLGAPGPLNFRTGILRFAPNLPGWVNVPLRDMLCEQLGVPAFVGNDADVAALAEHRFGAGKGVAHMIYLTISTGIGGGMIFNNRLFTGGHGLGGEVGHVGVDPRGPRHTCGNIGCLEVMASGTAIARRARERLAAGEKSSLIDLVDGDLARITAREVSEAGQAGDPLAISVFREAGTYIGSMLVGLMYMLNPTLFVLGGSVTLAGDLLFDPIRATVADRAPQAYLELTRIVRAELGGDVGLWGALALALMELEA